MDGSQTHDHAEQPAGDEKIPRIPPPGKWSMAIDELIEEAMRSGAFDNLPGKGKPLNLSNNPYAPETDLAYQLLKDNDYTLPWIAHRQEVLGQIAAFREELQRVWQRYRAEIRVAHGDTIRLGLSLGWRRRLEEWELKLKAVNKRIGDVNLEQPGEKLEIVKLSLASELARIGAGRDLLDLKSRTGSG